MKILIIGGTRFVGRYIAESALAKGHEVSLFNRGESNPELFPQAQSYKGNRDGSLDILGNNHWDAVIDTCGYFPRIVKQSVDFFRDKTDHYTFISSISVYADMSRPGFDETAPVGKIDSTEKEEITEETYGPYKAVCEADILSTFGDKALIIRPGLIVGPHDMSDRFTYYVVRAAQGGDMLLPAPEDRIFQCIDVRDLAEWTIIMVENKANGIYNACGPDYDLTMKKFIGVCKTVTESRSDLYWADEQFLIDNGVEQWTDLPIWISDKKHLGMLSADNSKAIKAGLKFRPLIQTVKDTYEWAMTRPEDYKPRAGLDPEKEKRVLEAWYKRGDAKA